ncbi:hypothetical protein AALA80_05065 [Oscillospiraceae bacterium 50-60]
MSSMKDKVLSRLYPENKPEHRFTVLVSASKVAEIKRIAKAMSEISGRRVTQTMLFEDAVDAFIEGCMADPQLGKFLSGPEQPEIEQQETSEEPAEPGPEQDENMSNGPVMSL